MKRFALRVLPLLMLVQAGLVLAADEVPAGSPQAGASVPAAMPRQEAVSNSAAFRVVMGRMCEQKMLSQMAPMMQQIKGMDLGPEATRQVCDCAINDAFSKPRMASALGRVMVAGSAAPDEQVKAYFVARFTSSLLVCMGNYMSEATEALPQ